MSTPRYVVVEKKCCGTCVHYRQHYILSEHSRPFPLWYGHCATPRRKRREPDEVCPYWSPSAPPDAVPEEDDDSWWEAACGNPDA